MNWAPEPSASATIGTVRSTESMNPSQAGKPPRASSIAGARTASRDSRPNRACASPHERTAPGTVIVSGPRRGRVASPWDRSAAASAPAGARPDPFSATCARFAASQISQNASPPIPQALGMTVARTAFVAIAASTAWPPARRIERPAAVARWCGATTAPWRPRARGTGTCGPRASLTSRRFRASRADPGPGGAPSCAAAPAGRARRGGARRSPAGAHPSRAGRRRCHR